MTLAPRDVARGGSEPGSWWGREVRNEGPCERAVWAARGGVRARSLLTGPLGSSFPLTLAVTLQGSPGSPHEESEELRGEAGTGAQTQPDLCALSGRVLRAGGLSHGDPHVTHTAACPRPWGPSEDSVGSCPFPQSRKFQLDLGSCLEPPPPRSATG